jgi:hypothetical protein
LARAPKNCICFPIAIGDTQQAIAPSSPQVRRMISSLSNWIELVSMATLAANCRNASGRRGEYQIVRFGSGAGPRLERVCRKRKLVLVTSGRPSSPSPPIDSVTHVGSPANSSSYSGVRRKRTMRSLMTKSSTISWTCVSVSTPAARSRAK